MAVADLPYTDVSEASLIERARRGESDAYGLLHDRHVSSARAVAWRVSRSPADADDLVAEGFARVLAAIQRGGGPREAFRPYLLTTIRRLAYDQTRRERRECVTDHDMEAREPEEDTVDPVVDDFERSAAAAAFATLPERWRMVLWHTEVEGQSVSEVADLLGIKANAVAALAYRAREGLRRAYLGGHLTVAPDVSKPCRQVRRQLGTYVRGGLSPAKERAIDEHLDWCEDCRAAHVDLLSVNTSLGALIAPAVLGAGGRAYLERTPGASVAPAAPGPRPWPSRLRARSLAALAAAAIVVVGGAAFAAARSDRPPPEAARTGRRIRPPAAVPRTGPFRPTSPPANDRADRSRRLPRVDTFDRPASHATDGGTTAPVRGVLPAAGRAGPTTGSAPTAAPAVTDPNPGGPPVLAPPVAPRPVDPPASTSLRISGTGALVGGRPGMLLVEPSTAGASRSATAGGEIEVEVSLRGATFRPQPTTTPPPGSGAGWRCSSTSTVATCAAASPSQARIEAIYLPIDVGTGPTVTAAGRTGAGGAFADPTSTALTTVPSGMAARYASAERGGIATAGNGLLTCPSALAGCAEAHAGSPAGNDDFPMVEIDTDVAPTTTNSSQARLLLPRGAQVLSAHLYWSGELDAGAGGLPAPFPAARGRAALTAPGGTVNAVVADRVDDVGARYQSVADVTDEVVRGGAGDWTLGGVQLGTGTGRYGGWSLVVAYRHSRAPLRTLMVLDGFGLVTRDSAAAFDVGGFLTSATGATRATVDTITYEGDAGLDGDQLTVGGAAMGGAANPLGNTFNSSAPTGRRPAFANLFGLDLDHFELRGVLPHGSTSTTLRFSTDQDQYLSGALALSVDR